MSDRSTRPGSADCLDNLLNFGISRRALLGGVVAAATAAAAGGCAPQQQLAAAPRPAPTQAQARRKLIRAGIIYTADASDRVLPGGWILVEGDQIAAIGGKDAPEPKADQIIDASRYMVLPGMINAHWHECFVAPDDETPDDRTMKTSAYSKGGDIESLGTLFTFVATIQDVLPFEEALPIARWSMWTQLRSGTTTLGDIGSANSPEGMAQAALDLGMRIRMSRWSGDIVMPNSSSVFHRFADAEKDATAWVKLMDRWGQHPSGLVRCMPGVMGSFCSSDEQLKLLREVATKYDSPYCAHLGSLRNEAEANRRIFGISGIERFEKFGLLTDKLLSVHTAWASEDEYKLLLKRRVNIVHSPAHYGQLGEHTVATGQIGRYLRDGGVVASSTDGNIWYIGGMPEAMRAAHLGHNEALNDIFACPPLAALRTGTRHGATALGWDDKIGSLEIGKQADIVIVDIDDFRYATSNHPLRTFLVCGSSKDVRTVIVAGRVVVEEGRSTTMDEEAMLKDLRKAVVAARARFKPPG
ncbi:amidohydrolase family protein [Sorangium sp. So ce367]|uniref:amidohydrolase family protein n=1 Tax=Sorangium sp. So ce367 TaxID=3133305 RepID=UPI003F5EBD37